MPKTKLEAGLYSDASDDRPQFITCAISLCICCIMCPAHLDISERFCNNKSESFRIFHFFFILCFLRFPHIFRKESRKGQICFAAYYLRPFPA